MKWDKKKPEEDFLLAGLVPAILRDLDKFGKDQLKTVHQLRFEFLAFLADDLLRGLLRRPRTLVRPF